MKLTLATGLFVAASAAAFAQAPAGSSSTPSQGTAQQRPMTQRSQATGQKQGEQTLTGCLTSADNIYTLTVMDDSGAPGTTATTTAYTLAPGTGVDLQAHVNKRVTVKGTDAGPDAQSSARVVESSGPTATGTSGTASGSTASPNGNNPSATGNNSSPNSGNNGGRPTVQTTSKARLNAKTLNVTDVQPASGNCGAQ